MRAALPDGTATGYPDTGGGLGSTPGRRRTRHLAKGTAVESALGWLLQPMPVADFLREVWATRSHLIERARPGYFDQLLAGPSAADDLLAALRAAPSAVRLVRGPEHRASDGYLLADGDLDLARVRADYGAGFTVILDNIERHLRPMTLLTHAIEVELNFPTHVNAYLSPPNATGFLPHYDHHDVLVLQIHGAKTWHFYGDAAVPPHLMQQRYEPDPAGLPAPRTLRLRAGDTLYLPRGLVHSAQTGTEPSVHLTVGIHVPTVLTLLTHALHLLSVRDDRIHTRLPARHLDDPRLRADLAALVHDAVAALDGPDAIADGLEAMQDLLVRRGRCPPVGQRADTVGVDGATLLVKNQPLYSRVTTGPGGVGLQFAQLLVSAGHDHEAALRFLAGSTEAFRAADLPGLTAAQQLELVRSLIMSGFLKRA